jgi:cell division protein FtsB
MRWVTIALAIGLLIVQADLWFSRLGWPDVWIMRRTLEAQQRNNEAARARNERLAAEVADLDQGTEMIEEQARRDLGMIRADEILIKLPTTSSKTPAVAASGSASTAGARPVASTVSSPVASPAPSSVASSVASSVTSPLSTPAPGAALAGGAAAAPPR